MRPTIPMAMIARQNSNRSYVNRPVASIIGLVMFWLALGGVVVFADEAAQPGASAGAPLPVEHRGWIKQWLTDDPAKPFEFATALITLGGFIVTAWSILKLTQQTTIVGDTLRQAAIDSLTSQAAEANKLFIESPELRRYFYDGCEIKESDPDYAKVQSVAEYMLDYFDSVLSQLHYFPKVWASHKNDVLSWERYIKYVFENSPVLREMLGENEDWYGKPGEKWRNMVDLYSEVTKKLAQAEHKVSEPPIVAAQSPPSGTTPVKKVGP